jgi:basic amino acid/polyamine antiporter, APA family
MTDSRAVTTESSLVRVLGTWGLAAGIINVTIGGGIFRLPSAAASALGSAAPLAYLVCATAMGLIVLCFAEAGSRVSLTGGLYAYVEVAFGPFVGFMCGALLWMGMTAALAAVTSFFADSVGALVPALATSTAKALTIVIVLALLAGLNVLGVKGASRFNSAMTVAKLLPLALLIVLGAFAVKGANLAWSHAPATSDVARASAVLMFAFLGVESALVPSGEVRDPARTVPRAIFIAIAAVYVVYISVQLVTQGVLGPALAGQKTPVAEAAGVALGGWARAMILVGSSVSMFGYVSAMTLAVPRVLFAFARDGILPPVFARVHERYRTPHVAIAAQALVVAVLAASGTFEWLALVANGAIMLVYGACCLAVVQLRRRDVRADGAPPFQLPGLRLVPWLALVVIAFLLTSLNEREWLGVLAAVVIAAVTYFLASRRVRTPVRDVARG